MERRPHSVPITNTYTRQLRKLRWLILQQYSIVRLRLIAHISQQKASSSQILSEPGFVRKFCHSLLLTDKTKPSPTKVLQEKTHSGRYNLPPFHIKYMSTTLYSSWVPPLQKGERAGWVCQQQLYGYMWVTFEHKTLDSNENKLSGNLTTGCSSTSCTNQPFELVVFFFLLFRAMGTPHAINDQSTSLM